MGKRYERSRIWELGKQTTFRCYPRANKEIKKAQDKNQGLSSQKIKTILNCCKSFIGCFACDQLQYLSIQSFPIFLIVNTDRRGLQGSHWISIRISESKIELFDSLGLIHDNRLPMDILAFIQRFTISRQFVFNGRLQPEKSVLCGFYSILYIILRQYCSFNFINSYFGQNFHKNERIVKSFFNYT